MSFGKLLDLPIGILPGSVLDDPAVPQPQGAPPAAAAPAQAMTGKTLALKIAGDLAAAAHGIRRLVQLQESNVKNFIGQGTTAYGGTAGTVPTPLLLANPNRRGLSVQNIGASGNLTLGLGTTAPQAGTGITLQPGTSWDGRISGAMWTGSVSIVGSAPVAYTALEA